MGWSMEGVQGGSSWTGGQCFQLSSVKMTPLGTNVSENA